MIQGSKPLLLRFILRFFNQKKASKGKKKFELDKRQKFGIGVAILSIGIFFSNVSFNISGIFLACFLGIISDLILFWAIRNDLKESFTIQAFILPFLYSLSFGFFSFLTPSRIITRTIITFLYAIGLYSTFLSENIFTVASIRTIALLHSARIVSLIISLITYFFILSTSFSLHTNILITIFIIIFFSFFLNMHAIWTYTLEKSVEKDILWIGILTISLAEIACILWFWPTTSIVISLFLTSIWYVLIGLSHVWLDKRLFRNVLWEYIWVGIIAFLVLLSFTKWQ
jgi:hypothetical protein